MCEIHKNITPIDKSLGFSLPFGQHLKPVHTLYHYLFGLFEPGIKKAVFYIPVFGNPRF